MKSLALHDWHVRPDEAKRIQLELAKRVSARNEMGALRLVAGADMSIDRARNRGRAAVVVLTFPDLQLIEKKMAEVDLEFPYVPGLLSFREAPAVLRAVEKLRESPDLLLVDGHGLAHPRRFGIACHLGLLLDMPTIGVAKSRLIGAHGPVGEAHGSQSDLTDRDELIGIVLRTKAGSQPVYVSIAHKIDLETAARLVMELTRNHRLPEPARQAHQAAAGPVEDWHLDEQE